MMLIAEHLFPLASIVISLLKRMAQRTSSLTGRACRPLSLAINIFRVSDFVAVFCITSFGLTGKWTGGGQIRLKNCTRKNERGASLFA
jgi:hypothetical protein